jgi:hypothetical protein
MLPKNEKGEKISIDDVFHSLNKRLNSIWMGINSLDTSYSGDEFGYRIYDSIDEIKNYIDGFPATEALKAILYPLSIIEKIRELIEAILNRPAIPQSDDSWAIPQVNDFTKIKEELCEYELFLESIQDLLLHREEVEGNTSTINNRIPIKITVPQFSRLLSLLCNEDNRTDVEKIFDTDMTKLCNAIITIFKQEDGRVFTFNSLYDKQYDERYKIQVLDFWIKRFKAYQLLCANLKAEEEKKIFKRK